MEIKDIQKLLKRCCAGDRTAQQRLYSVFYPYAMSVSLRFANSKESAEEIVNDSFLKVFTKLETHNTDRSFRAWLRKIVVNTALDYARSEINRPSSVELDDSLVELSSSTEVFPKAEEIIALLQQLSPMYRVVFNLYVMEGYSHDEIAVKLNISAHTSRANLSRAKARIVQLYHKKENQYA